VPGDLLTLETPLAVHTYKLLPAFDNHPNPFVVKPSQSTVLLPKGERHLLTLTTCHPKGSARQRLVATFELVKTVNKPGVPLPTKGAK
jgi:sortase (surface protein transpeptidase)